MILSTLLASALASPRFDVLPQVSTRTSMAQLYGPTPVGTPSWQSSGSTPLRLDGIPLGLSVAVPFEVGGASTGLVEVGGYYDALGWKVAPSLDMRQYDARAGLSLLTLEDAYAEQRTSAIAQYATLGGGVQTALATIDTLPDVFTFGLHAHLALGMAIGRGTPRLLVELRGEAVMRTDVYNFTMQTSEGSYVLSYWPGSAGLGLRIGVGFR